MTILLDWSYKFIFDPPFDRLTNIYTVTKIYTYSELAQDSIDLFSVTYAPYGITEIDYETDELPKIRTGGIYKLVDVVNESNIQYIPEHMVKLAPDPNVKKYQNLTLAWHVGAFENMEELTAAQDTINQLVSKLFGVMTPITPLEIGVMWLSDSDYQDIQNQRQDAREKYISWYSENINLRKEIDKLKAITIAQNKLIKAMMGIGNP